MIAEKLRKAILQAAMQGKLTQQLPEDGDARDLLAEIQQERQRKIKTGEIKATKPLPPINPDEALYEIPENWVWTNLGDVIDLVSGRDLVQSEYNDKMIGIPYITGSSNINRGVITINRWTNSPQTVVTQGNLVVTCKGTVGNIAILKHEKAHIARQLMGIQNYKGISIRFIKYFLELSVSNLIKKAKSIIPGISRDDLLLLPFPIPPQNEQKRIVFRIQNFLRLLDNLEKVEKELDALEKEFPEKLKKSLLQAAMQGKLTEQLPEDGDARHLLAEIQQERQRKIKTGEIKATKPLPPINPEEAPYEIPPNWVWTRLGNVVTDNRQKAPETEFTYIDIGSINNKLMKLGSLNNVLKPNDAPTRARKIVKFGDVIYSTVRPYLHNASVIDVEIKPPPIASTGFFVASPIWNTSASYVLYWLVSPISDNIINDVSNSRGVAYPAISESSLKRIPIPLPPFSEQKRLVARLDALLPLCEGLKPT